MHPSANSPRALSLVLSPEDLGGRPTKCRRVVALSIPKEEESVDAAFVKEQQVAKQTASSSSKQTMSKTRPHLIFIIDVSGSMGSMPATLFHTYLPRLAASLGYEKKNTCDVITFASETRHVTTTIGELAHISYRQGCTCLAMVPLLLDEILKTRTPACRLVVVSDGCIDDPEQTLAAGKLLGGYSTHVETFLVRYHSSYNAQPDTRALSLFGMLSSTPVAPVEWLGSEHEFLRLGRAVFLGLDANTENNIVSESCLPMERHAQIATNVPFSRLPEAQDKDKIYSLSVPYGSTTFLFFNVDDDNNTKETNSIPTILVDGMPVVFSAPDDTTGMPLHVLFDYAKLSIAMRSVAGLETSAMLDWLRKFIRFECERRRRAAASATSNSAISRVAALRQELEGELKTMEDTLAQLGNQEKLKSLNKNQQAEFLRQLQNTSAGRAVAKRVARTGVSAEDAVVKDVERMAKLIHTIDKTDATQVHTLLHLRAPADVFEQCKELEPVVDRLSVTSALQELGGVGVPFVAKKRPYPDPWMFAIDEIWLGSYFSECEVYEALCNQQRLPRNFVPGYAGLPSGVFPLRNLHPSAYDAYVRPGGIAELHAGVAMRGVAGIVPGDLKALSAAMLVCMLGQPRPLSEAQSTLQTALAEQCRMLCRGMKKDDGWTKEARKTFLPLTTKTGVFNGLAGSVAFFNASPEQFSFSAFRSLFAYLSFQEARHRKRHVEGMTQASMLRNLLQLADISTEKVEDMLNTFSVAFLTSNVDSETRPTIETCVAKHVDRADMRIATAPLVSAKTIQVISNLAVDIGSLDKTEVDAWCVSNEHAWWRAYISLISIQAEGEDDYCVFEDFVDEDACRAVLHNYALRELRKDYMIALEKRLAAARANFFDACVNQLLDTTDMAFAVKILQKIGRRDAPALAKFINQLTSMPDQVPLAKEKAKLFLLGYTVYNEEKLQAWNSAYQGKWSLFKPCFVSGTEPEKEAAEWREFQKERRNITHVYRPSEIPNRHGHSADKPSYFALGFATLADLFSTLTKEEREAYMNQHAQCCGTRHWRE